MIRAKNNIPHTPPGKARCVLATGTGLRLNEAVNNETNNVPIYRAKAPGSLMIMGEHAVLHGKRALVAAVDRFMSVTVTPQPDSKDIRIRSVLGADEAALDDIPAREPFRYIWRVIQRYDTADWPSGFDLDISSEFSSQIGFGSSAAVTVATLAALDAWLGRGPDPASIHRRALDVIQAVQGRGSGADAAASVYGGLVEYRCEPPMIKPMPVTFPVTVLYAGYKTPTPEVIAKVEAERLKRPALFEGFFYEIDECVRDAVDALCRDDWSAFGQCLDTNHALMDALGVNDQTLEAMVKALRACPDIQGAKISGSGLGDCVIGLGDATRSFEPYERISCAITKEGVQVEQA